VDKVVPAPEPVSATGGELPKAMPWPID